MHFQLRSGILPADFQHMATILNATHTVQTSPAELAEHHNWWPEGSISCLTMACDEAGQVIGFAEAHRFPNTAEGKFYADLAVLPAFAGHGVGSALLAEVEQFIANNGGNRIMGDVQDTDTASLAYVEKRGYKVERHWWDSKLDLSSFDAGAFPAPAAEGIRFFTLADEDTPAMRRALYELYGRTMVDIPGYEAKSFMTYETWERFMFEGEDTRLDWVMIAADGAHLVGVTQMVTAGDHLYTNHTLVDREYRGRGIALALKLLTIQAALKHGAPCMSTGNDSLNGPMLAVNRKLGYKPLVGGYTVVRHVVTP